MHVLNGAGKWCVFSLCLWFWLFYLVVFGCFAFAMIATFWHSQNCVHREYVFLTLTRPFRLKIPWTEECEGSKIIATFPTYTMANQYNQQKRKKYSSLAKQQRCIIQMLCIQVIQTHDNPKIEPIFWCCLLLHTPFRDIRRVLFVHYPCSISCV